MPPTTIHVRPTGVPDETTPGIETRDLARLFRRSPALAGLSVRVEAGRAVAVLGPNGAGKTTLLRILATAIRPSFGSAAVDGIDVAERPEQVRPRVALLPHATGLYDDLTAAENLAFGAALMQLPGPDRAGRVAEALERVGLAAERDARVGRFSAGMRRRLALARILLGHPRLVLLDEPYAALDAAGLALVDDLLAGWRASGATVLVATHATERLEPLIDGWMRLEHGLLAEVGGAGVSGRVAGPVAGAGDRGHARRDPAVITLRHHLAVAGVIAAKDLRAELRGRQAVTSTLFLAAVTMLVFGFALGPDQDRLQAAGPGLLWLAVVLSGMTALGRLHHLETEDGAFELLGLYPISRTGIYLGKALGGLAAMLALGALVLPLTVILFAVDLAAAGPALVIVLVLGAVGVAAVGTLYAGLTVRLRAREVLLPLLLLPVAAPLLLAAVSATSVLLAGDPFGELAGWLQLLAGFDVAMLLAGGLTYGLALEE